MASTSTISSLGVGSGIDAESIVTKLVALESQPITQLKTEASKVQSKISAYGKIQSAVSDLQSAARKITSVDTWGATTASSSDATAVTASSGSGPAASGASMRWPIRRCAVPTSCSTPPVRWRCSTGAGPMRAAG